MVDINKMARAAGIGSAVGAVGGIIKASNDSEPNTSSNILGSVVGGAIIGSVSGAGISAGKRALQNKLTSKAYNQSISNSVMAEAEKVYAKHGMPSNASDLNVAAQISKATSGNTKPITPTLSNAEAESIETTLKPKKFSNFHEAQEAAWKGINNLDDIDEYRLAQVDEYQAWYNSAYNAHKQGHLNIDDGYGGYIVHLPKKEREIVPGYTARQAYFDGIKDSIKENLRAKGVYRK